MPTREFRFIQPCVFNWAIMDVSPKNHIMAIEMMHGTKWTAEFDDKLHLNLERCEELRNCERWSSSQASKRNMDHQMGADDDNVEFSSECKVENGGAK